MKRKRKKISKLDIVILAAILALAAYIVYRLTVTLNYKWNWSIIPQYIVRYDSETGRWVPNLILQGLLTTIRLSFWATLLATVIGGAMGILRSTRRLFNRLVGGTYVELIRNVPPLVLVFLFYFFIGDQLMQLMGVDAFIRNCSPEVQKRLAYFFATPDLFSAFLSGVVTIAIFQGAYITEIVRAGIQSLERGQWEASYALGLTWFQQMRYIILPQATRRVLPPLANEFINTIKYSAIVSVISIQELTFQGWQIMTSTHATMEVWLTVTAMYLVMCLALSLVVQGFENYLARSDF